MQHKILRIGTRGSELAVRQARLVEQALRVSHPDVETRVVPIRTAGDDRTDIPLCEVNKATGTGFLLLRLKRRWHVVRLTARCIAARICRGYWMSVWR